MSTSTVNLSDVISAGLQAGMTSFNSGISAETSTAYAQALAENITLKSSTPEPAAAPKPAAPPVMAGGNAKTDAGLLALVRFYRGPETTYVVQNGPNKGKTVPKGALAVKVHGYLHTVKHVPETTIREYVAGAVSRNVISKLALPGQHSLYFDAKDRPNSKSNITTLSAADSALVDAAFGM